MISKTSSARVAARSTTGLIGWNAAALASLVLLAAPHAVHAAPFQAKSSDAIGRWVADAKDPSSDYQVTAGSGPDELQLISPVAAKTPPILLRRTSPSAFASAPSASPTATFTLKSARHATVKVREDSKTRFGFTYLLLDKQ